MEWWGQVPKTFARKLALLEWVGMGCLFQEMLLRIRNKWNIQSTQKLTFAQKSCLQHPWNVQIFRNIMYLIPHPSWGVRLVFGESIDKGNFVRNWMKYRDLHRKNCVSQPQPCMGWGLDFLMEKCVNNPSPIGCGGLASMTFLYGFGHFLYFLPEPFCCLR